MGIFDIIELKQHVQSLGEYVLYIDAHPQDSPLVSCYMRDHLRKMIEVLDKMDNSS